MSDNSIFACDTAITLGRLISVTVLPLTRDLARHELGDGA